MKSLSVRVTCCSSDTVKCHCAPLPCSSRATISRAANTPSGRHNQPLLHQRQAPKVRTLGGQALEVLAPPLSFSAEAFASHLFQGIVACGRCHSQLGLNAPRSIVLHLQAKNCPVTAGAHSDLQGMLNLQEAINGV